MIEFALTILSFFAVGLIVLEKVVTYLVDFFHI